MILCSGFNCGKTQSSGLVVPEVIIGRFLVNPPTSQVHELKLNIGGKQNE